MTRTLMSALTVTTAAALVLLTSPLAARSAQEGGTKTIYLSVTDESGKPVKDMTADDIRMREDGKDIQIVSMGPAQAPLNLVFLVDTSDSSTKLTQDIRNGVTAFIKQLHSVRNDAAIQLMEFGQAAVATTPWTTDDEVLTAALNKMVGKPTADAVLLEALQQSANNLAKRPSQRRAVVSLNADPSRELVGDTNRIKDAFRKSVAQLWSLSLQIGDIAYQAATGANGRTAAAATMNLTATRNAALTQLAQQTGGQHEMINSPAAIESILKGFADVLTYQYEVVYKSPNKNAKVVQVGTTRDKVKLHASGFPPQ